MINAIPPDHGRGPWSGEVPLITLPPDYPRRLTPESDSEAGWRAHPEAAAPRGRLLFTLEVDGETFAVRGHDAGTDYDWISGPNKDYGFSSSGGQDMPAEWHRDSIRSFLSMIDPQTGYIAED